MNDDQLLRYSRQILLPQIDVIGQQKLLNSCVLIIGLGGLGSPVAMYLVAAGIGYLILVDDDQVELSNLQHQIAHGQGDIGRNKVLSAADTLKKIDSSVKLELIDKRIDGDKLKQAVDSADVVVDCSDNFNTKFLLNKIAHNCRKPLVSGAAIRMEGQIAVYDSRQQDHACYRCLYDDTGELQQNCSENGVLSPLLGIIGGVQAMEVVKCITKIGKNLSNRLLILDALEMTWKEIKLQQDPACPVCSKIITFKD
ncbi:MAG: molybdopterin-synthase adenylyltransferase MoeB [Piscirickettsiaceae bacterium]|nr:molybdopterin-synthase adenylyltransferase MoeB [Piscirickettsiaceae bacterium]